MAEVIKIVLTGGPCAGKTTALKFASEALKNLGISVFTVEETATKLMKDGITPQNTGRYEFHNRLFEQQLKEEKLVFEKAAKLSRDKAVVLIDRGLLDSRAYVLQEEFDKYSSLNGLNESLIRSSYNAVFHLVSAANGAEKFYGLSSNSVRSENTEQAKELDKKILALWIGTPHLRIIDNSTDFEHKLERLIVQIKAAVGIPEPLETERKFLIEYPDISYLSSLELCRKVPIEQAYIITSDNRKFRIRRRGEGSRAVYIKTVKTKISDLKRIETETYISKEEYYKYLGDKELVRGIISKDRYCLVENAEYYELDIYPFWKDRATIEIELLDENQPYTLPSFVKLIREVSSDPDYRNYRLACKNMKNTL